MHGDNYRSIVNAISKIQTGGLTGVWQGGDVRATRLSVIWSETWNWHRRTCGNEAVESVWLARSEQTRLGGGGDIEFEPLRLSKTFKCEAGAKQSRWKARGRQSSGGQEMECCWRPCSREFWEREVCDGKVMDQWCHIFWGAQRTVTRWAYRFYEWKKKPSNFRTSILLVGLIV